MVTTGDPPLEPGLFSGGWWTTAPALPWLHEGHWGRRGTKKWTATETKEVEHLGSKAWTVKNGDKRASTPIHDWTLGTCHGVARASTAFLTVSMRKPMIIHRNWGYTAVWSFDSHNSNGNKLICRPRGKWKSLVLLARSLQFMGLCPGSIVIFRTGGTHQSHLGMHHAQDL